MRPLLSVILALHVFGVLGCAGKAKAAHTTGSEPQSIGVAWLESDGTLVMQLRAEEPGKARGDALLRYKPDNPDYHRMLEHIGNLKPGQTNPVPPWPQGTPGQSP
jgi:hypothetical protein